MIENLSDEGFQMLCDQHRNLCGSVLYLNEWLNGSPNIKPFELDFWNKQRLLLLELCESYGAIIELRENLRKAAAAHLN